MPWTEQGPHRKRMTRKLNYKQMKQQTSLPGISARVLHSGGNALHRDGHGILDCSGVERPAGAGRIELQQPNHVLRLWLEALLLVRALNAFVAVPHVLQVDDLQNVQRRDVGGPQGDLLLQGGGLGGHQQTLVSCHLEQQALRLLEHRPELFAERAHFLWVGQPLLVILGDGGVQLGENHLHQVDRHLEEGPLLVHLSQHVQLALLDHLLQGCADAEPNWKAETGLRPREHPRDGPQGFDARVRLSLRGPASDVHAPDLSLGGRRLEVPDEPRVLVNHLAELVARDAAQLLHEVLPLLLGDRRGVQGVLQGGTSVQIQGPEANVLIRKALLDDLALHRDPQLPVDGARWLGPDRKVQRTTATAHGATSTVKERQGHAKLVGNLREVHLGPVEGVSRSESSRILATVAVPKHALLAPVDVVQEPFARAKLSQRVRGLRQVTKALKQGNHVKEGLHVGLLLQEKDREDVRG
mmetsp:Transcript_29364/g.62289  ORF Transcript_29364/g.62289 Transcript_29364/m.62289 type:complete len:469 (+) Transcript_29364:506-1912(+)